MSYRVCLSPHLTVQYVGVRASHRAVCRRARLSPCSMSARVPLTVQYVGVRAAEVLQLSEAAGSGEVDGQLPRLGQSVHRQRVAVLYQQALTLRCQRITGRWDSERGSESEIK